MENVEWKILPAARAFRVSTFKLICMSCELEYHFFVATGETPQGKVTEADVQAKLVELNITDYPSLETLSYETHMACLLKIERTIEARKNA